ncbi:MAG: lipoprotein-anchoring transpeptidase ErfK/SrfK [Verrucomicrobiales bacterium]|jgi:lipoprotein-anchoring transpeptidase ErfK/SrfK
MHMHLEVSVPEQTMLLKEGQSVITSYTISTSKFGLGTELDSNRTPLGNFAVFEKIGHDAPLRTIFRGRMPVGIWDPAEPVEEDLVLTRILWLDGLDPENANTRDRYIYIHGTNQEHLLGTAASHGCIRMANIDVAALFDLVDLGISLRITD